MLKAFEVLIRLCPWRPSNSRESLCKLSEIFSVGFMPQSYKLELRLQVRTSVSLIRPVHDSTGVPTHEAWCMANASWAWGCLSQTSAVWTNWVWQVMLVKQTAYDSRAFGVKGSTSVYNTFLTGQCCSNYSCLQKFHVIYNKYILSSCIFYVIIESFPP